MYVCATVFSKYSTFVSSQTEGTDGPEISTSFNNDGPSNQNVLLASSIADGPRVARSEQGMARETERGRVHQLGRSVHYVSHQTVPL
jgi:hypothetical protein